MISIETIRNVIWSRALAVRLSAHIIAGRLLLTLKIRNSKFHLHRIEFFKNFVIHFNIII